MALPRDDEIELSAAGVRLAATVLVGWLLFQLSTVVYALYLSPLSRFPGPKLAVLTSWYEFYHDVVLGGRFAEQVGRLHREYGPIVRISPAEIHVSDPDFFTTLFAPGPASRRDRHANLSARLGFATDVFSTAPHDLHRLRRRGLAPRFSPRAVAAFQPSIRARCQRLCRRLGEESRGGAAVRLDRALVALVADSVAEFAFGRSWGLLEKDGFDGGLLEAMAPLHSAGSLSLHLPIAFPMWDMLPEWLVRAVNPKILPVVRMKKELSLRIWDMRRGKDDAKATAQDTIFHTLRASDLPEQEKTDARLADEAQLVIALGMPAVSRLLTVACFHLCANPDILARLRAEILSVPEDSDWRDLERLECLRGCVKESLRLAHGLAARQARMAPDEDMRYRDLVIPRNTPVSMTMAQLLMDESVFPEPKRFRPERWADSPDLDKYLVAFGGGERQCLGYDLAMAHAYIAVAAIFSRLDFELCETSKVDVEMEHAHLLPFPQSGSRGVQAKVRELGTELQ